MASTGGAAPGTYTPTPTKKTQRSSFFSDSDVDWLRPDGRGFHQCRPACIYIFPFSLFLLFIFFIYNFISSN
jgi:hypothetical protein